MIIASADIAGRTGAKEWKIEYQEDPVKWWCEARFKGARRSSNLHDSPGQAADELARLLLAGGQCTHCHRTVILTPSTDGCLWRRVGKRWELGCTDSPSMNRAARRKKGRR